MIGGRALDRVVAVLAEGQGSGVLLDRRYVLTAWHVVESGAVEAIHPSARSTTPCKVIWENKALDVALLRADAPLVSAERAAPMGLLRTGRVDTPEPLPHCQIVGFPEIQRYGDENALEYDQYRVSVLPMAGHMRRTLVCELDRPPADEAGRRDSPLQGLSGAPVFAGAVLWASSPRSRAVGCTSGWRRPRSRRWRRPWPERTSASTRSPRSRTSPTSTPRTSGSRPVTPRISARSTARRRSSASTNSAGRGPLGPGHRLPQPGGRTRPQGRCPPEPATDVGVLLAPHRHTARRPRPRAAAR
ncbi:hypothetical protein SFUMM280S_08053 [Streptomyces fumanus]